MVAKYTPNDPFPTKMDDTPNAATVMTGIESTLEDLTTEVGEVGASRLVQRFASTTARDAAITSPVDGMVCSVAGRLQLRRSGSWRELSEGSMQFGGASGTSDGTGYFSVTFPTAYPSGTVPAVVAMLNVDQDRFLVLTSRSNTGFTVRYYDLSTGTLAVNATIAINWIALV